MKNKAKINKSLSVTALKKRIKELEAENAQLKSQLTLERGKMKNMTGRRSVVNLVGAMENDSNSQEPLYSKYTGGASRTIGYKTNILLSTTAAVSARDRSASLRSQQSGDDHSRQRSVSQTLDRLLGRNSEDGDTGDINEVDGIQALTTAVSIAEHTLVTESEEYMKQIQELKDKLKEENDRNLELEEKSQEQIKEINIAETTISHLRRENQVNAVQVHEKTKELEELQKKLALLEFQLKDYKRTFPTHKTPKPPKDMNLLLVDDSSDIGASDDEDNMLSVPGDNKQKKDSMDIQLESLQNYLSSLNNNNTADLTEFKESLQSQVGVLPELQADLTNKFEQNEKFFGRLEKKTNKMEGQIQSIYAMLQGLSEEYKEDKEARGKLHLNLNAASTDAPSTEDDDPSDTYGRSDDDLYDDKRGKGRNREIRSETFHVLQNSGSSSRAQEIEDEIINSEPSCWSSVFFCGQKNETDKKEEKKIKNGNKKSSKNSHSTNRSGSAELPQSRSLLEYDDDQGNSYDYNNDNFVMRINSGGYGDDTPVSQTNGHRYQRSRGSQRSRNGGNNKKRKKKKRHRSRNLTVTSNTSYE